MARNAACLWAGAMKQRPANNNIGIRRFTEDLECVPAFFSADDEVEKINDCTVLTTTIFYCIDSV
jgi:hypothetical protein